MFRHVLLPFRTLLPAVAAAAGGGALLFPSAGLAGAVRTPIQPEVIIGAAARPACDTPTSPFTPFDLLNRDSDDVETAEFGDIDPAIAAEALASATDGDLQPVATICSPTFAAFPAAFGGTIATNPRRSRVGAGWRELGGNLAEPAQFLPGDVLTVPEVDDAAKLRVAVASHQGSPTAVAEFTDLSPGPSQVTLAADERGLVARLTRADGSVAESITRAPVKPTTPPKVSGRPSRIVVTTAAVPGSIVSFGFYAGDDGDLVRAVGGTARGVLQVTPRKKRKRTRLRISIATVNRPAQIIDLQYCTIRLKASQAPKSISCDQESIADLIYDFADEYALGGRLRAEQAQRAIAELKKHLPGSPPLDQAAARPAHLAAAVRAGSPATQLAVRSQAGDAPLTASITPQTVTAKRLRAEGLRPLAADVNGDGGVDYWASSWSRRASRPLTGGSAGVILVSGPAGLAEHRVDLPRDEDWYDVDSDISAIGDVTGDGIGELVVDLDERHAIIPGSAGWTNSTFPIVAPDLTDLEPEDRVVALDLSSPGSPFNTLDDVNGDGKRELFAADDGLAWMRLNFASVATGAVTRAPSAARAIVPPAVISNIVAGDQGAPRVDPATRFINGQAVSLRWPALATEASPNGTVTIAVQDADGRELRPTITVTTPGNALLLDYDRVSGDALMLSASARCRITRWNIGGDKCRFAVLRVGPDGRIVQTLAGNPNRAALTFGTARFLQDGADADQRPEAVIASGVDSVALLPSTSTGAVKEDSLATARLKTLHRRARTWAPLRFYPVFTRDGARRLVVPLPSVVTERYGRDVYRYTRYATTPAELRWK